MLKLIKKYPFISGFIAGYFVFGRGLKKLIQTRVTIIKFIADDACDQPSGEQQETKKED